MSDSVFDKIWLELVEYVDENGIPATSSVTGGVSFVNAATQIVIAQNMAKIADAVRRYELSAIQAVDLAGLSALRDVANSQIDHMWGRYYASSDPRYRTNLLLGIQDATSVLQDAERRLVEKTVQVTANNSITNAADATSLLFGVSTKFVSRVADLGLPGVFTAFFNNYYMEYAAENGIPPDVVFENVTKNILSAGAGALSSFSAGAAQFVAKGGTYGKMLLRSSGVGLLVSLNFEISYLAGTFLYDNLFDEAILDALDDGGWLNYDHRDDHLSELAILARSLELLGENLSDEEFWIVVGGSGGVGAGDVGYREVSPWTLAQYAHLLDDIRAIVLGDGEKTEIDKDAFFNRAVELNIAIKNGGFGPDLITPLGGVPHEEIASLALEQSDRGLAYRYALVNLNSFVLHGQGVDYSRFNQNGELELKGADFLGLTEEYIRARARLLAQALDMYANELPLAGVFFGQLDGVHGFETEVDNEPNRLVFGSEVADTVLAKDGIRNQIFAMDGDDAITGGTGADYIEGGRGYDTYHVSDGDAIFDADGSGRIFFDGIELSLAAAESDGVWWSLDREFRYSKDGIDLVVKRDSSGGEIRLKDFFRPAGESGPDQPGNESRRLGIGLLEAPEFNGGVFQGTENNDIFMEGSAGNDIFEGLDGVDMIFPPGRSLGDDAMYASSREDYETVHAQTPDVGGDQLSGGLGNDQLYADNGTVALWGASGSDSLFGGPANDYLSGDEWAGFIAGPPPTDWAETFVPGQTRPSSIDMVASWTNLQAYAQVVEQVDPHDYGDDVIFGGGGDDFAMGGGGSDTIDGGTGDDIIYGDLKPVYYYAPSGDLQYVEQAIERQGNDTLLGGEGDDEIYGQGGNDHLDGGLGADELFGGLGNDTLLGGDGSDTIYGEDGEDQLDGGQGADHLHGGLGSDTYIYHRGGGADAIYDADGSADVLRFGPDISPRSVTVAQIGTHLQISIGGGEGVVISNWFSGDIIERIEFADGTVWTPEDTEIGGQQGWDQEGTEENDHLAGSVGPDNLSGKGGDDYVQGMEGNDTLSGDFGNDYIEGGDGEDVIRGGAGDDYVNGGAGNDTVHYRRGDGSDVYEDADGDNVIVLEDDITSDRIQLIRVPDGLSIIIDNDGTQAITVKAPEALAQIRFADGTRWERADIENHTNRIQGSSGNDVLLGTARDEYILGLAGDDEIDGGGGRDVLVGSVGNDTYIHEFGRGRTTVAEFDSSGDAADRVRILGGLTPDDVTFRVVGNHLFISLVGSTEEPLRIENWVQPETRVEFIEFEGWGTLEEADVQARLVENHAPVTVTEQGALTFSLGQVFSYVFDAGLFADEDGDALELSLTLANGDPLPEWMSFDAATHTLVGYAPSGEQVDLELALRAADPTGAYATQTFAASWAEYQENQAPTVTGSVEQHTLYPDNNATFALPPGLFLDPDGDALEMTAQLSDGSPLPDWLLFDSATGAFSATPTAQTVGTWQVVVMAEDPQGATASVSFAVVVNDTAGDTFTGTPESDELTGSTGDDRLYGLGGDDTLLGLEGNDELVGGAGNDVLRGGAGDDVYVYGSGDGADVIDDIHGSNVLRFGDGITPENLSGWLEEYNTVFPYIVYERWRDLHLNVQGVSGGIYIPGWLYPPSRDETIHRFEFSDGTVWGIADMLENVAAIQGTASDDEMVGYQATDNYLSGGAGNDALYGGSPNYGAVYPGHNWLFGGAGNDYVHGHVGDDHLYGGDGNDTVIGLSGDDYIVGGAGDDELFGGDGEDTYEFSLGHGSDYVTLGSEDRIIFTDVVASDVSVSWDQATGTSLILSHQNGTDRILTPGYFREDGALAGSIHFADGEVWTAADVRDSVRNWEGTSGDDTYVGNGLSETMFGYEGNDVLYGHEGDDLIDGGDGDDIIEPGSGNNVVIGGRGSDAFLTSRLDTVRLSRGDGVDRVTGYGARLEFGESVSIGEVTIGLDGRDLVIDYGQGDSITVQDWWEYSRPGKEVSLHFASGEVLSADDVWASLVPTLYGTEGDDTVVIEENIGSVFHALGGADSVTVATRGRHTVYGGDGDDSLSSVEGVGTLHGGAGNDQLNGLASQWSNSFHAVLDGGVGNDLLINGDIYTFSEGDGHDVIRRTKDGATNNGHIVFDASVAPDSLVLSRDGDDLIIDYGAAGDRITVEGWLVDPYWNVVAPISEIRFADGTALDVDAILVALGNLPPEAVGVPADFGLQTTEGASLSWTVPETWFDDPEGQSLVYELTLTDGQPLPAWISFDPSDGALSATVPDDAEGVQSLRLTAIDPAGGTVSVDFDLEIAPRGDGVPIQGGDSDDVLVGTELGETISGGGGDDHLQGMGGDDLLFGEAGRDRLDGGPGDDTLDGGGGDGDRLTGQAGNDVYLFGRGDGNTEIRGDGAEVGDIDVVRLKAGIAPGEVTLRRAGNHLSLLLDSGEELSARNFFLQSQHDAVLDAIEFEDGTRWQLPEILVQIGQGTAGNDQLVGSDSNDTLDGGVGHDSLFGEGGNDLLLGGEGDDSLSGGTGDDVLDGGPGLFDDLTGAAGNDTYLFGIGDGGARIFGNWAEADDVDVLKLGPGISPDDVVLRQEGDHLGIRLTSGETIQAWYFFGDDGPEQVLDGIEFADGTYWNIAEILSRLSGGSNNDDILYGTEADDILDGGYGNDTLIGYEGNDTLIGGAGDDSLQGREGDDILDGGLGNDGLQGGAGSDVYLFGRGDGNDTLYGPDGDEANETDVDILRLKPGIAPQDVTLELVWRDLVVRLNTGEAITVFGFYQNSDHARTLAAIEFDDGTRWEVPELLERSGQGTPGDDLINGTEDDDVLAGGGGNDHLRGFGGSDLLIGGAGSDHLEGGDSYDTLDGGEGDDTLDGGAGDDDLYGGSGSDTYLFGHGDGNDWLSEFDSNGTDIDVLRLKDGIAPDSVNLSRDADDLVITLSSGEQFTAIEYFYQNQYEVVLDAIEFQDGTRWNTSDILARIGGATDGDDVLQGTASDDTLAGGLGNDQLYGQDGNDLLLGGGGDDLLDGGADNDVLEGGAGNDQLIGRAGDDTYRFGPAAGSDLILDDGEGNEGSDVLVFDAGIDLNDVTFSRLGDDLLIALTTGEQVTVSGYFLQEATARSLDSVQFHDGTVLDYAAILTALENRPPEAAGVPADFALEALEGESASWTVPAGWFTDPDGDTLSYELTLANGQPLPGWMSFDAVTGALTSTIPGDAEGDFSLRLTARDPAGGSVLTTFVFTVLPGAGDPVIAGTETDDVLSGTENADVISGVGGNDVLHGLGGDDELLGGEGNDRLEGGAGNDLLDGGAGDDEVLGQAGDDTYRFGRGDGADRILAEGTAAEDMDVLRLKAGIAPEDVTLRQDGDDLVVRLDTGEQVTVAGYFVQAPAERALDAIAFDNGTVLDQTAILEALENRAPEASGVPAEYTVEAIEGESASWTVPADWFTDPDGDTLSYELTLADGQALPGWMSFDTTTGAFSATVPSDAEGVFALRLTAQDPGGESVSTEFAFTVAPADESVIHGTDGDDLLQGSNLDDVLIGGEGNDQLVGGTGDDELDGGAGDDVLYGQAGNDTVLFGRGDGADRLFNNGVGVDDIDVLRLKAGIAPEDVTLRREGNHLVVRLDTGEQVSAWNFFYQNQHDQVLDAIEFEDGTRWDLAQMLAQIGMGSAGDDVLQGSNLDDVLVGGEGNDQLLGGAGDDELDGGAGDDVLYGQAGNDTVLFGRGDGADRLFNNGVGVDDIDVLRLKAGIAPEDVTLRREGNHLVVRLDTGEQVSAWNFFYQNQHDQVLDAIEFEDGTRWGVSEMLVESNKSQTAGTASTGAIYESEPDVAATQLASDEQASQSLIESGVPLSSMGILNLEDMILKSGFGDSQQSLVNGMYISLEALRNLPAADASVEVVLHQLASAMAAFGATAAGDIDRLVDSNNRFEAILAASQS